MRYDATREMDDNATRCDACGRCEEKWSMMRSMHASQRAKPAMVRSGLLRAFPCRGRVHPYNNHGAIGSQGSGDHLQVILLLLLANRLHDDYREGAHPDILAALTRTKHVTAKRGTGMTSIAAKRGKPSLDCSAATTPRQTGLPLTILHKPRSHTKIHTPRTAPFGSRIAPLITASLLTRLAACR